MGRDLNPSLQHLMDNDPEQPSLVDKAKTFLFEKFWIYASKKWGGIVQTGAGAAVAYLANNVVANGTAWLGEHGVVLSLHQTEAIYNWLHSSEELIVVAGGLLANWAVQWVQTKWNIRVQKKAGAKPDGWIHEQTVAAVAAVVDITPSEIRRAIEVKQDADQ